MVLSKQISETLKDEVRREVIVAGKTVYENYSKRRDVGFNITDSIKGSLHETGESYLYKYIYRLPYEPIIPAFRRIR